MPQRIPDRCQSLAAMEELDAGKLAGELIMEQGEAALRNEIRAENMIPGGFTAHGDRRLIYEVMRSLFSNAAKFTGPGGRISFCASDGGMARISVKDTGVGIGPDILRDIFNHEVKTSTPGTAGERGSGLGLPLCREIMLAHGGQIGVISNPGQGSEFYITLPKTLA